MPKAAFPFFPLPSSVEAPASAADAQAEPLALLLLAEACALAGARSEQVPQASQPAGCDSARADSSQLDDCFPAALVPDDSAAPQADGCWAPAILPDGYRVEPLQADCWLEPDGYSAAAQPVADSSPELALDDSAASAADLSPDSLRGDSPALASSTDSVATPQADSAAWLGDSSLRVVQVDLPVQKLGLRRAGPVALHS